MSRTLYIAEINGSTEFQHVILKEIEEFKTITVIIELPPKNSESVIEKLGLAGHTAICIEDEYYDYGPDYDYNDNKKTDIVPISEKEYQYDFNDDGDMDDIVMLNEAEGDYYFTLGKPWWDDNFAKRLGIVENPQKLTTLM